MPQQATPAPALVDGSAGPSATHLVLIPSYNPGVRLHEVLRGARAAWNPVWVVVDGSTDGSAQWLQAQAATDPGLQVLVLPSNQGKGAAVLHGIERAAAAGYTHVLVMDSDGQHPAQLIPAFMAVSQRDPGAMVLGRPRFDASAPRERVYWRRMSNFWVDVETLWAGIGDSLFGFRVYPIAPLRAVMRHSRWMRRFDFDPEVAVRLCWRGVRPINLDAPVRYFKPREGGVSHFRYLRDNLLLAGMHLRLLAGFVARLPVLAWRRWRRPRGGPASAHTD
ncbi:glycosyltransferase family 2 protein [Cupriavidus necator]|uniref:glycosyltransferase family 2 protein n=1 Tax=Cupriavidus necator TaxID=106590 RepID=UPI0014903C69|nr:glycosyltransferase family 2 protein [Cupriavidus necator]NOV22686.1 glycosyltransferase family 2 protein [Cupriavidus necator]